MPDVTKFDLTSDNPLKSPYVIQTRISGYSLQKVYSGLSHKQLCAVTKDIGKTNTALQAGSSARLSLIEMTMEREDGSTFAHRPFDIRSYHNTQ